MLVSAPGDPELRRVDELLAHTLEFHRRENKALWWFVFDRAAMTEEELIHDRDCLAGLRRTDAEPVVVKRSVVCVYSFPPQESTLRADDSCYMDQTIAAKATIDEID